VDGQEGKMSVILSINKCPAHGYWSISIGDEHGSVRLTEGKCCGRWDTVREWRYDETQASRLLSDVTDEILQRQT
jgi:hypothetical protein